jgi:hypothetical protein
VIPGVFAFLDHAAGDSFGFTTHRDVTILPIGYVIQYEGIAHGLQLEGGVGGDWYN